ncbi:MAG TPA: TSUP family transporter, partial [Nitrolancea sp.]|nr:TSUP family transporter [Nitrolancea sp.]
GEPDQESAITLLPIVIRVMLTLGMAFILIGTAIGLVQDGALPTPVISFSNLPSMLADFNAAAFITLGILVCLITPATYIFYMGISYARAGDWLYTLIAGIVFLIIMGSIVVAALSSVSSLGEAKPSLSLGTQIGILVVSAVAGVLGSMLGLGGGVFIVPILSAFFGVPLKVAIAASAVSVVVNSLGGTSVYLKHNMSNVRLGMVMELTTAVGAIIGGLIVVWIAPDALRVIFGVGLLGMGIALFLRQHQPDPITSGPDPLRLRQVFHDPSTNEDIEYIPQRIKIGVAAGSLAGIISGMLGIGGGAVKVPIMNAIMRVPVKASAATSVFMVGITVSASAFIYYLHNIIDLSVTVPAVLGVLIGSQTGARASRHLKNVVLIRFLVLILVYLAVTLLLQAFGINLPGTSS